MGNALEKDKTNVCGIAKKQTKESTATNQNQNRLVNMTKEDVEIYLANLAKGTTPPLSGLEGMVEKKLKMTFQRTTHEKMRLEKLTNDIEVCKDTLAKLKGRIDAYSDLLVFAEDERRGRK